MENIKMRVRKRKNGDARKAACGELVLPFDKENLSEFALSEIYPDKKTFCIEIGCGKGAFITGMAQKHPDIGFFAVEKVSDVMVIAAEKIRDRKSVV